MAVPTHGSVVQRAHAQLGYARHTARSRSSAAPSVASRATDGGGKTEDGGRDFAFFRETGTVEAPRYEGALLAPGTRIVGPAIITEPTTTVVVYPGSTATITPLGNYLLEIGTEAEALAVAAGLREEVSA